MSSPERVPADYFTSARVARILGITKRTLLNWVKSGKIPTPEVNPKNGYLLWTIADVEAVRNARMEESH
jgi:DNA-binding transcriptional MerR regulator